MATNRGSTFGRCWLRLPSTESSVSLKASADSWLWLEKLCFALLVFYKLNGVFHVFNSLALIVNVSKYMKQNLLVY